VWERNCIRSRVSKMERKIRYLFSVTKDIRKTCWLSISSGILPIPAKISRVVFFPATDSCRQDQIDFVALGLFRSETSDYSNSIDHVIFKEGSPRVVDGFAVLTNHISQWGNTSNVKYVCKI
jgi:hypothetical protein